MLRIALCDDEEFFLEALSAAVRRILAKQEQACQLDLFRHGEALLQAQPAAQQRSE